MRPTDSLSASMSILFASAFVVALIVCCSAADAGIPRQQLSPEADEHLRGGGERGGLLFPFPVRPEQYNFDDAAETEGRRERQTTNVPPHEEKKDNGKALEEEEEEEDEERGMVPPYMLELYRRFSNDKHSHPMADIVRSFKNINTGVTSVWTWSNSTRTALHSLHFNISSINSEHEDIQLAELRLRTSKKMQTVSVYEVIAPSPSHPLPRRLLASSRDVSPERSTWQVFPVTETLRRWAKQTTSAGHVLQVSVDTVHLSNDEAEVPGDATGSDVSADDDETILVVFSNRKRRSVDLRELRENRTHENEAKEKEEDEEEDDEEEEEEGRRRRRRRNRRHHVYPPSSHSSSSSSTQRPSSKEEEESTSGKNSTRPASKARLLRLSASSKGRTDRRTTRRTRRTPVEGPKNRTSSSSSSSGMGRRRRSRRRKRRDICRRKPMYVDFQDIKWENRILEPSGYQAYECTGQCYFPIGERLSPTRYATVKSLLHATYPKRAGASCCVPTRLEPIALLYADEQGIVTYQYQYEDMVVAECGCR